MRPSISQLFGWDLDALGRAAKAAGENAQYLDAALDRAMVSWNDATWYGQTRDAAAAKLAEEVDHAHEVRNVLKTYADEADDAARLLAAVRDHVKSLIDGSSPWFIIEDTGEVTSPDPERAEQAELLQRRIQDALSEAERLDNHYGPVLNAIAQDLTSIKEGQRDVALPGGGTADPDEVVARLAGMTPDERAAFLAGMSPADVRQLVLADPEAMGNMNGVPFAVRIAANEINIRNALDEEWQKGPDRDQARVEQLEGMLRPIPDPRRADSHDAQDVPDLLEVDRKFVAFSTEGNGHMIEMLGGLEPGVSGAAVFVPGMGTTLNSSDINSTAAWNLAHESNAPVFLYMEGDLPQVAGPTGATSQKYAEDMAPKLKDFGQEVDREVAAHAPGTKVTYIGHSYGGSVVGSAEQLGLRADRVLYASSAGTGVYEEPWRNPNPEVQRFSMTAPGDRIGVVQSAPGNPHGNDPDEVPGVTRLDTGYYSDDYSRDDGERAGEVVFGEQGHGDYWNDPGSTAFDNAVGVVSGGEVRAYVERGVETDWVDVNIGDDGDFLREGDDASTAWLVEGATGGELPIIGVRVPEVDPYEDPEVVENPGLGPRIDVE